MDMNEPLLKSVEILPALPDTICKLKDYVNQAGLEIQINKIADLISADPLITARLLQLANSPYYGFSREITTINQVITLLGATNIINIITADSIRSNFTINVSPYGLDTALFLEQCNEEINFISQWLNDEDKKLSQLLVPCAMLLRLGMIIFSNFLIQNKKDKEFLSFLKKINFEDLSLAEHEFLGVDHVNFLGFLLHKWNFDSVLIESICFVRNPHAASHEIKKSAYALAITDHIFMPHGNFSQFNLDAALALIKEAKTQNINFNLENFLNKLPSKAKQNLH